MGIPARCLDRNEEVSSLSNSGVRLLARAIGDFKLIEREKGDAGFSSEVTNVMDDVECSFHN